MKNKAFRDFGVVVTLLTALETVGCVNVPTQDVDRPEPQSFMVVDGNIGVHFQSDGQKIFAQAVRRSGDHWKPIRRLKETYDCYGRDYRDEVTKDLKKAARFSSKARKAADVLAAQPLPSPESVCGR